MEPPYRYESWRLPYPLHHHHHHHRHHYHHNHPMILSSHHHPTILCPLHHHHHHHLITCHSHVSPTPAPLPLSNRLNSGSTPVQNVAHHSGTQVVQEQEYEGLEEVEEEEEEEPILVLTDEWREFFAKSEAKRKLEKQQAKKKQKN